MVVNAAAAAAAVVVAVGAVAAVAALVVAAAAAASAAAAVYITQQFCSYVGDAGKTTATILKKTRQQTKSKMRIW